jgi:hypothetical protein
MTHPADQHARSGPLLRRGQQGVLGQVLGQGDIAHQASEAADEARGLAPPHPGDRLLDLVHRHRGRNRT